MSIEVVVYGAERKCASCVNLPSSKETMEWLEALLNRKYPEQSLSFEYIDIEAPKSGYEQLANEIIEEDRFYPFITINDQVVAEGDPRVKTIYKTMDTLIDNQKIS
ncbi:disulfide oxidoreductase [Bacillaceae bacterium JMAK1]|nr:disulfide oxidoreductase [Bacillaceae bacterium JMAK1]